MVRNRLLNIAEGGVVADRLVYGIWVLILVAAWLGFELVRAPFITVDSVTVDRAPVGTDPSVSYVRSIHRTQKATWTVDMVGTTCHGEGVHTYQAGSQAFDWHLYAEYMEAECSLDPGAYAMLTCYEWLWGLRRHCAPPVAVVVTAKD